MKIKIFTTGGTIDKVYFDQKSTYQVGHPKIEEVLEEARVNFDYDCVSLVQKDSLDLTDEDREIIKNAVLADECERVILTHGTDTMVETAKVLQTISGKVIVLTGAIEPARFRSSDAAFNIGCAVSAVQCLPPGVYIAMSGRVFHPDAVKKNLELNRFEEI